MTGKLCSLFITEWHGPNYCVRKIKLKRSLIKDSLSSEKSRKLKADKDKQKCK